MQGSGTTGASLDVGCVWAATNGSSREPADGVIGALAKALVQVKQETQ